MTGITQQSNMLHLRAHCKPNTHQASNGSRKPVQSLNDARFQLVYQTARENKLPNTVKVGYFY